MKPGNYCKSMGFFIAFNSWDFVSPCQDLDNGARLDMSCIKCGHPQLVKNRSVHGKAKKKCTACGYQFTKDTLHDYQNILCESSDLLSGSMQVASPCVASVVSVTARPRRASIGCAILPANIMRNRHLQSNPCCWKLTKCGTL